MKEKTKYILIFLGITLIGLLYNYKYINDFPSHIHAWAQSDRYSLAIGFTENKLNIFKPQTFVYNRQFPDKWEKSYTDKIVSVDFPIHDYIPAIIMSLTKNQSFWIFRLYILIYSFFGLFFLFRLSREITNSNIKAGLITFIAATSPIFVYYQAGFLPTIPSLANAMIGLYFYYKGCLVNCADCFMKSGHTVKKRSQSAIAELAPFSLNGQFTGREMLRIESYTAGRNSVPSDFIRPHLFWSLIVPKPS